ncbi:hypothetical protein MalM25_36000 [Planctomycetes bacterium MalM25]|nr:hypothetical protein MalM25_36000 [Planctomycetes bacterium MalM25]
MRRLACVLLLFGLGVSAPARAQDLPPELVELFEQIGIPLDENGVPTPPPAPPQPTAPAEPLTPEELSDLLGLPVWMFDPEPHVWTQPGTTTTPVPQPDPVPPTPIADPITPEELAELLGLPVELFTGGEPTPPAPPVQPPEINTPEELFEFLGISPIGVGEQAPVVTPPVTPISSLTPDDLDFWLMLGFDGFPGQPPVSATVNTAVPEPSSALLLALAAGLVPRRRR